MSLGMEAYQLMSAGQTQQTPARLAQRNVVLQLRNKLIYRQQAL